MSRRAFLLKCMQQQQQGQRHMASKHKRPQQRGKDGRYKKISPEASKPGRRASANGKETSGEAHAATSSIDPWHYYADWVVSGLLFCALAAGALGAGWCAGYLTARFLWPLFW